MTKIERIDRPWKSKRTRELRCYREKSALIRAINDEKVCLRRAAGLVQLYLEQGWEVERDAQLAYWLSAAKAHDRRYMRLNADRKRKAAQD